MSITVKSNNTPMVAKPEYEDGETYFARVVQVVDLGLQSGGEYLGTPKPDAEQVLLTFEFGEVLNGEGKPGWLSVILSLPGRWEDGGFKGMHIKSNLLKYLEVLYPTAIYNSGKSTNYRNFSRDFSWEKLLGAPAQLTVKVIEGDNGTSTYINRGSISRVPAKFMKQVEPLKNAPLVLNLDTATVKEWSELYPWVRAKIRDSLDPNVKTIAIKLDGMLNDEKQYDPNTREHKEEEKPKSKTKPKSAKVDELFFDDDIPF